MHAYKRQQKQLKSVKCAEKSDNESQMIRADLIIYTHTHTHMHTHIFTLQRVFRPCAFRTLPACSHRVTLSQTFTQVQALRIIHSCNIISALMPAKLFLLGSQQKRFCCHGWLHLPQSTTITLRPPGLTRLRWLAFDAMLASSNFDTLSIFFIFSLLPDSRAFYTPNKIYKKKIYTHK